MNAVRQLALPFRHAPHFVADAYCATRLGSDAGRELGELPPGTDARAIVERARSEVAERSS